MLKEMGMGNDQYDLREMRSGSNVLAPCKEGD